MSHNITHLSTNRGQDKKIEKMNPKFFVGTLTQAGNSQSIEFGELTAARVQNCRARNW